MARVRRSISHPIRSTPVSTLVCSASLRSAGELNGVWTNHGGVAPSRKNPLKLGSSSSKIPEQRVEPTVGFEPTTCGLRNRCSNQLSYVGNPWHESPGPDPIPGMRQASLRRIACLGHSGGMPSLCHVPGRWQAGKSEVCDGEHALAVRRQRTIQKAGKSGGRIVQMNKT